MNFSRPSRGSHLCHLRPNVFGRMFLLLGLTVLSWEICEPAWAQETSPASRAPAPAQISDLYKQATQALKEHDYAEAERLYKAAYQRAVTLGDPYAIGIMLDGLSNVYTGRGDSRQAIAIKTQAITLLRQSGQKVPLAGALLNLGVAYMNAGLREQAFRALTESNGIWKQLNDVSHQAVTMQKLGNLYSDMGQFARALETFQDCLTLRDAIRAKPSVIAETHRDMGLVYAAVAQFGDARREYQLAMQLAQAADSPAVYASALSCFGNAALDQGRYAEAWDAYTKALQIQTQDKDSEATALSLGRLGSVAFQWGRYDVAAFYVRRSLAILEKGGAKALLAQQYGNLGAVLSALGQRHKAEEALLHAVDLYGDVGNFDAAANTLFNLGLMRFAVGDHARAMQLFTRVLEVAQKHSDGDFTARTLRMMAVTQEALGKTDASLDLLQQSHSIFVKLNNPEMIATSLADLGVAYAHLKRRDEAIQALTQSLAIQKRLGMDKRTFTNTQSNLALLYKETNQWDKSAELLKEAIASAEALRDQVASPSDIASLQNNVVGLRDVYTRYASVLLHGGNAEEALLQVERGRGQGMSRQTVQGRTTWTGLLPDDAARKITDAIQALRQAEANLQSAQKQANKIALRGDSQSVQLAERQVNEAERIRNEIQGTVSGLRNDFSNRYPRYRTLCGLDTPVLQTYMELAKAHPDTLYLSWAVTPDSETLLFVLRADIGLKAFSLPVGDAPLTAMVREWREAIAPDARGVIAKEAQREETTARALYDALFAEVEKAGLLSDDKTKRLVMIGDGPLRELPFAALIGGAENQRLVERFPLSTGVSLRLLASAGPSPESGNEESGTAARRRGQGFLCVADPGGGNANNPATDLLEGFAPLPAARKEGLAIGQIFGNGATVLVGDAATKEAVLRRLGSARFLHFATHGYLDEESGLKSGLLIAPTFSTTKAGDSEPEEIPLLTGEEIMQHPLAADLVTLSACETGRGEHGGGDGLLGLVWAFQAAGCPSIVASQWSVEDSSTGQLMVKFYEALKAGRRRDEALRDAMLAVRADATGKHASPYYWAAFELHGDASALGQ